jgi:hypothetical protein
MLDDLGYPHFRKPPFGDMMTFVAWLYPLSRLLCFWGEINAGFGFVTYKLLTICPD